MPVVERVERFVTEYTVRELVSVEVAIRILDAVTLFARVDAAKTALLVM